MNNIKLARQIVSDMQTVLPQGLRKAVRETVIESAITPKDLIRETADFNPTSNFDDFFVSKFLIDKKNEVIQKYDKKGYERYSNLYLIEVNNFVKKRKKS